MSARKDITGRTFGSLTVVKYHSTINTHAHWILKCSKCNDTPIVSYSNLLSGNTLGCKNCYHLSRWKLDKEQRLSLCIDYIDGMKTKDILRKYNIKSRGAIYRILKSENISTDRKK